MMKISANKYFLYEGSIRGLHYWMEASQLVIHPILLSPYACDLHHNYVRRNLQ